MKRDKLLTLWNNYYIQLLIVVLSAVLLIIISIVLLEDIDFDNRMLIYNIFGSLTLVGFLHSYNSIKKGLKTQLEIGITRKEIFQKYIINMIVTSLVSIGLVVFYMYVYARVIVNTLQLFASFDLAKMLFLPIVFLLASSFGFTLGILRTKKTIVYSMFVVLIIALVYIIVHAEINYLINLILGIFIIIIGITNYFLVNNYLIRKR